MNCKPSQLILFGILSCCFHSLVSQKNKLQQYYCILGKRLAFPSFNLAVPLCKRVNAFRCLLFFNLILAEAPTSLHPTSNTIEIWMLIARHQWKTSTTRGLEKIFSHVPTSKGMLLVLKMYLNTWVYFFSLFFIFYFFFLHTLVAFPHILVRIKLKKSTKSYISVPCWTGHCWVEARVHGCLLTDKQRLQGTHWIVSYWALNRNILPK